MKKIVALKFTILYCLFITLSGVNVNAIDDAFAYNDYSTYRAESNNVNSISEATTGSNNLFAIPFITKTDKHPHIGGKVSTSRGNTAIITNRDFLSFLHTEYQAKDISMSVPLLYQSAIFLKNCVLRI